MNRENDLLTLDEVKYRTANEVFGDMITVADGATMLAGDAGLARGATMLTAKTVARGALAYRGAKLARAYAGSEIYAGRSSILSTTKTIVEESFITAERSFGQKGLISLEEKVVEKAISLSSKTTRTANFKPCSKAKGPHSIFRRHGETGKVHHYETFKPQTNPRTLILGKV
ncbi:MAG: hypothetical protein JHC93_03520 [Parachlamydiales bacterium]|nr:hypothetical protein [Parachlamydiales bacterium]